MNQDYYTLQITFNPSDFKIGKQPQVMEFHNLQCPKEFTTIQTWCGDIGRKFFVQGFSYETAPGTRELIAPFRIISLYLIKQPGKL